MNNNKEYWAKKEKMSRQAAIHTEYVAQKYADQIKYSIDNTEVFDDNSDFSGGSENWKYHTFIRVVADNSETAIMKSIASHRMAVLNFASYKNPGGMFLKGSTAQEESLCHHSFLYNVLSEKKDFYNWNRKNLNKALYMNRALYSPDILFYKDGVYTICDVITCAAPNKKAAKKYNAVSELENEIALFNRIQFVLDMARYKKVSTLILGAYGCGVFGQDSYRVAGMFRQLLETKFLGCFENVIFAIPFSYTNNNLNNFLTVFEQSLY